MSGGTLPSRRSIALWVVVGVLTLTVMADLATVLSAMHLPGRRSGTVTSIATPFADSKGNDVLVRSWFDADAANVPGTEHVADPGRIAMVWLLIDSLVFAPTLAIVLYLLSRRRRAFLDTSSWLFPILGAGTAIAVAYLFADEVENAFTAGVIFGHATAWSVPLRIASGLKLFLVVAGAAPVLVSFVPAVRGNAATIPPQPPLRLSMLALRVPLAVAVVASIVMTQLPLSVRPQLLDVVRSWVRGDRPATALWALVALLGLLVVLWSAVSFIRERSRTDTEASGDGTISNKGIVAYAVVLLVIWPVIFFRWNDPGSGLLLAVAIVLSALFVTSIPSTARQPAGQRDGVEVSDGLARGVIALPALAFVVMVISAIDFGGPVADIAMLGFVALIAGMIGVAGWLVGGQELPTAVAVAVVVVGLVASVAVAVAGWLRPLPVGWGLGSVAVVIVSMTALLGLLMVPELLLEPPPRAVLAQLHVRRVPILTVVVLALIVAPMAGSGLGLHVARLLHPKPGAATGADAVEFSKANLLGSYDTPRHTVGDPKRPVLPVVVVAASGGGGRAQYWTLDALNCLFGRSRPPFVEDSDHADYSACAGPAAWTDAFAASGISGGSVGLAMYAANVAAADARAKSTAKTSHGPISVDVKKFFKRGFLDPIVDAWLFKDIPNVLARMHTGDRANALELALEDAAPSMRQGLFETQLQSKPGSASVSSSPVASAQPLLMLSSTAEEDGCRINVSAVDLAQKVPRVQRSDASEGTASEPLDPSCRTVLGAELNTAQSDRPLFGTRDLADFVCDEPHGDASPQREDVRLSTAAVLSARFAYVSPTGALAGCEQVGNHTVHTFAIDGGYVDSSASSPLVELLHGLIRDAQHEGASAPCIQPIVIQIDNSYEKLAEPTPPDRPQELLAPLRGQATAGGGHTDASLQALAQLAAGAQCALPADLAGVPRYLHLYPEDHPGAQAPLGWSLSRRAQQDLDRQLGSTRNQCAILAAKVWLNRSTKGLGSCLTPRPSEGKRRPFATYPVCFGTSTCADSVPELPICLAGNFANKEPCKVVAAASGNITLESSNDSNLWSHVDGASPVVTLGDPVVSTFPNALPNRDGLWGWCLAANAMILVLLAIGVWRRRKQFCAELRALL
jgi:hypothetical protein